MGSYLWASCEFFFNFIYLFLISLFFNCFFFLDLNSWDMLSLKFFFLETIGGSKLPFFFGRGSSFYFECIEAL